MVWNSLLLLDEEQEKTRFPRPYTQRTVGKDPQPMLQSC